MQKFHGYKIESNNLARINTILITAKKNINLAATEIYHKLLSEEITELVDNIAMDIIPRPTGSLIDAANASVVEKIRFAESRGLPTEYNLAASVQIIPADKVCYLLFCGTNSFLEEAFASTTGIEDYSVELEQGSDTETISSERGQKWLTLQKQCEEQPTILYANMCQQLSIDPKLLVFAQKEERANVRARHELTNQYINMYAAGKQIAPYELMSLMDRSLSLSLDENSQAKLTELKTRLMAILPEITMELLEPATEQK